MVAAVAVEDVERVDAVEMMLPEPGGEYARHAGIETRTEQRHQPRIPEPVAIGPLPVIFELRLVARLVVRGVEIMRPRRQARLHDRQVLIGEGEVDDMRRADFADQRGGGVDMVGVDLCGRSAETTSELQS